MDLMEVVQVVKEVEVGMKVVKMMKVARERKIVRMMTLLVKVVIAARTIPNYGRKNAVG